MLTNQRRPTDILNADEIHLILRLRLLIARAANKDSLAWWDDESLTPSGDFLLERLFPMAPPLAGRSLALKTATIRWRNDIVHRAGRFQDDPGGDVQPITFSWIQQAVDTVNHICLALDELVVAQITQMQAMIGEG